MRFGRTTTTGRPPSSPKAMDRTGQSTALQKPGHVGGLRRVIWLKPIAALLRLVCDCLLWPRTVGFRPLLRPTKLLSRLFGRSKPTGKLRRSTPRLFEYKASDVVRPENKELPRWSAPIERGEDRGGMGRKGRERREMSRILK